MVGQEEIKIQPPTKQTTMARARKLLNSNTENSLGITSTQEFLTRETSQALIK
jgi:hypothetical protein